MTTNSSSLLSGTGEKAVAMETVLGNVTAASNHSSVAVDDVNDYPPLVTVGIPILCILVFAVTLALVLIFPNQSSEETFIDRLFPDKQAKPRRRARTTSQRLEEEDEEQV